MTYLFEEGTIKSVANLLTKLRDDERRLRRTFPSSRVSKPTVWFRGLRNIARPQVPTFHWKGCKIADEIYLMNLFKQNSGELLTQLPTSEWEWMFLMRHHNLPSRLLDWTENPLTGLYFAVKPRDNEADNTDGVLWCLLPTQLNRLSLNWPDDESLPMLSENPAEFPRGENDTIGLYLPSRMRMLSIRAKRPPAAGICPRTNRRMQVQMSVFTIHHADKTPIEFVGNGNHIWRYRVPLQYKKSILADLQRVGISERILFPSLDNVAAEAELLLEGH